ncbi:hypothetical protein [Glutamicibacter endophyticus]|uniref:hypothetical protein n=1 Tax=Glutamicibacter endophyticus TaxID=1522174 RepID=UPI003AEF44A1
MELNTVASIVAAVGAGAAAIAALVALVPALRSARASENQSAIQREIMEQNAQPYVWADIQPDNQQGTMLHLVVGNSGPTMARNVRVFIDPPIPEHPDYSGKTIIAQKRAHDGILSLAPGRTIRWSLGRGFDLLKEEEDRTTYRIRVKADGPFEKTNIVEFEIRPSDWREARDAPEGNLHFVRKAIEDLTHESKQLREVFRGKDVVALINEDIDESSLSDSITQHRQATRPTSDESENS